MKNVLVTGGAGFIGSNFIRYLLSQEQNIRVFNLDALTYASNPKNLDGLFRHYLIQGDICDPIIVEKVVSEQQIDTIVHFAAESHVDRSIADPEIFVRTNVLGTFVLLEAAREHNLRFHHVSTDEVYGTLEHDDWAWTENAPYGPRSPYSASKASSDHLVRAWGSTYGLNYTITTCSNNYGRFQDGSKLIPLTILRALRGEPILIHGDGEQVRDWLHVGDCCEGIYTVLKRGINRETYNIGGGNEWSANRIVSEICSIMDNLKPEHAPHSSLIQHVEDRTGQDRRYALNTEKIRRLGWQPKRPLKEGLLETAIWYVR